MIVSMGEEVAIFFFIAVAICVIAICVLKAALSLRYDDLEELHRKDNKSEGK